MYEKVFQLPFIFLRRLLFCPKKYNQALWESWALQVLPPHKGPVPKPSSASRQRQVSWLLLGSCHQGNNKHSQTHFQNAAGPSLAVQAKDVFLIRAWDMVIPFLTMALVARGDSFRLCNPGVLYSLYCNHTNVTVRFRQHSPAVAVPRRVIPAPLCSSRLRALTCRWFKFFFSLLCLD